EARGLALIVDIALCDGEFGLRAAQLEVGARHLRGHRHLGIAQACLRALEFRMPRLDAAAHATEEVELPERIEAGVVEVSLPEGAGGTFQRRQPLPAVAAGGGDRGREIEPGFAANRPR